MARRALPRRRTDPAKTLPTHWPTEGNGFPRSLWAAIDEATDVYPALDPLALLAEAVPGAPIHYPKETA